MKRSLGLLAAMVSTLGMVELSENVGFALPSKKRKTYQSKGGRVTKGKRHRSLKIRSNRRKHKI